MNNQILVAPGLKKNEILKSMALRGINTFGLRIYSAVELAENALIRSGIIVSEEYLTPLEENALVSMAASGEPYFSNITYADIVQIASALRNARSFIVEGDERSEIARILGLGPFHDKNQALINIYNKYIHTLKEQNKIDSVELIRRAISQSETIDADFITLAEFPLSPLVDMLVRTLSAKPMTITALSDFLEVETGKVSVNGYYNCYGSSNEVEKILDTVYRNYELDKCVVAVSDPYTYSQLFFDYMLLHDIPVTFGTGIPIINSNPAKLLKLYHHWISDGFFGSVSIKKMINSPSFDRAKLFDRFPESEDFKTRDFFKYLGNIRFVNNTDENLTRLSIYESAGLSEDQAIYAGAQGYGRGIRASLRGFYKQIFKS